MPYKPFIYLVQAESRMPYEGLAGESSDALLLTWRRSVAGAIHLPGSTWNEGRNRLLLEARRWAQRTGNDYLYYIFLDEDCDIREDIETAERLGVSLQGNPFRSFERFLLEWEPAIGYTRYDWQHFEEGRAVNLGHNFDALFNAYHREAVPFLLPYYTGFDAESWLYSQHLINHLATLVYHPHRIQYNLVRTVNRRRKGYAQRKKYWQIPTTFLRMAIRSELAERLPAPHPNTPVPLPGSPEKKKGTYRLDPDFVQRHFNRNHPFFRHRGIEKAADRPGPVPIARLNTAVLVSGRCRGLDRTVENLRTHLLDRLGTCDLFLFTSRDGYSHLADRLHPTRLQIEPDVPLDEGRLSHNRNCLLKTGVQAYLQQLHGLKQVNALRLAHEKETGIRYDCVIRCRPDLLFEDAVPDPRRLDLRYIHVPDFHQFEGINDRFAIGNPENMTIYMSKFDHFHDYVMNWHAAGPDSPPVTAEMFTAGHLREHGIGVRLIPVRFNRVRDHKIKQDTGNWAGRKH
ncbi:MAG: hypothetical protein ACOWWM_02850 [Desulfobacterales bacterium]